MKTDLPPSYVHAIRKPPNEHPCKMCGGRGYFVAGVDPCPACLGKGTIANKS